MESEVTGNCAPWHALRQLPPQVARGQDHPLRRPTDLDPKGRGDKSMFVKQRVTENVYVMVLQRLRDMVKVTLLEP